MLLFAEQSLQGKMLREVLYYEAKVFYVKIHNKKLRAMLIGTYNICANLN